jgi:hypothetical protein
MYLEKDVSTRGPARLNAKTVLFFGYGNDSVAEGGTSPKCSHHIWGIAKTQSKNVTYIFSKTHQINTFNMYITYM